jgi:hypothetical protein
MFEDIHIGHLALMLETCENHICVIMKYVFWMLEVNFSLWFMCNCWKMSPWIQVEFTLFPQKSLQIGHACADYSWDDWLLPPSSWKFSICTTSHWLIYSRTRKSPRPSLSSFISPNKDSVVFHCNKLLLVQLSFGKRNLTYLFGALQCSPYLENSTTLPLCNPLKLSIQTY